MNKTLNEIQRNRLKNHIKSLIKESLYENGYFENMYPEGKKKHHKDSDSDEHASSKKKEKGGVKRGEVMKWLDSAQELHSILAYRLWPEMDEDAARSLFSKKYRGEDSDGNTYSFDDDDINTLFNMKDRFIDTIS